MFHARGVHLAGYYSAERFGLGAIVAVAIAGYGLPGVLFGPRDRPRRRPMDRRWIIPLGLATGALGAAGFIPLADVLAANIAVIVLPLGYDLTQPLFARIVTRLSGKQHGGQAMGLNVFWLFTGFGVGSILFGELLRLGLMPALAVFAVAELFLAGGAAGLFATKAPPERRPSPTANRHNRVAEDPAPTGCCPFNRRRLAAWCPPTLWPLCAASPGDRAGRRTVRPRSGGWRSLVRSSIAVAGGHRQKAAARPAA